MKNLEDLVGKKVNVYLKLFHPGINNRRDGIVTSVQILPVDSYIVLDDNKIIFIKYIEYIEIAD